jgi:phytoene desaturase
MFKTTMKVIIIGSGIAGLASAVRLQAAGFNVTVLEANAYFGGKLTEFSKDGFRFDAGPSLFTLPQLVLDLYIIAKQNENHFEYIQLEKACNYFYEDGTRFTAYHNQENMANELHQKLGLTNTKPFFNYLQKAAFRYKTTVPIFIENSLHKIKNFMNWASFKGFFCVPMLNLFNNMNHENEQIFTDKRLVQYFNRFATYNGSNPYQSPALLNMIPHLESNIGTFFPKNGMHQISQSIYQLAVDLGVKFEFNKKVIEIILNEKNKQVKGIKTDSDFYEAAIVLSNMDIFPTYKKLLPKVKHPEKILAQEKSSSALIFYWGINKQFAELDLHNILFTNNYEEEFKQIFKDKTIYKDPTIYINITSKYKPDDAPTGCENWFVMINTPNNQGQNWDELIAEARKNIITKINRLLKTNIEEFIITENVLDPRSIETKTSSHLGALYGNASNNMFAAFLRHKNFSSNIKGLYFCGGSVHPGGGIPLCLNSAKIAVELIKDDYGM